MNANISGDIYPFEDIDPSLPHIEFSYNEILLLNHVFNSSPKYGMYKKMHVAYRQLSNDRMLIAYFIGETHPYTNTRKIQILITDRRNNYIPMNKAKTDLICFRLRQFYYEYLPYIESQILEFKLDNKSTTMIGNLSSENDNIFGYKIDIIDGDIRFRYTYNAV
jgi:hypothetical protein